MLSFCLEDLLFLQELDQMLEPTVQHESKAVQQHCICGAYTDWGVSAKTNTSDSSVLSPNQPTVRNVLESLCQKPSRRPMTSLVVWLYYISVCSLVVPDMFALCLLISLYPEQLISCLFLLAAHIRFRGYNTVCPDYK